MCGAGEAISGSVKPLDAAAVGFMDQEACPVRLLAAVENRPQAVRGTGPAGRKRGVGSENCGFPMRPVAGESEPGSGPRCRMPISPRSDFRHGSEVESTTCRTAVYGPVRTVVWEGRMSDPPPYPDPGACATRQLTKESA